MPRRSDRSAARAPAPAGRPDDVLRVLHRHRTVHPYGIADVVQLWARSTWWLEDDAVVALLDLPGATTPVVYAVAHDDGGATLDLVARLVPALPGRFECTAPLGFTATVAPTYFAEWAARYRKMHLARPE